MDVAMAQEWIALMRRAWRDRDPRSAAELFTEDAVYRSEPFRTPLHGRTAITEYWKSATSNQAAIEVTFGDPVVDGDRVAVEWWSVTNENGRPTTDAGGLFLRFEDGRCAELREYWNLADGAIAVPPGWGK
jgi:uncharacterized protein (TIGR02246 family)